MTGKTQRLGRLSIYNDDVGTWIEVASTRNGAGVTFLGLWLGGLSFAGYLTLSLMGSLVGAPLYVKLILSVWAAMLTLSWLATVLAMIWMALGREVLILRDQMLVKRLALPWFAITRQYDAGKVSNLRRVEAEPEPQVAQHAEQHEGFGLPVGEYGTIAFDHDGQEVFFGAQLKPPAADALHTAIAEWFKRGASV